MFRLTPEPRVIATLAEPGVLPLYSTGKTVQGSARLCVQQYVAYMNLLVTFPEKSLLWRPFITVGTEVFKLPTPLLR
jgi:hypothetical protein